LAVTADASLSSDGDSTPIASYKFDFGDGTVVGPQAAAKASHTYTAGGTFNVTVTVVDTGGLASQVGATVQTDLRPTAVLSATPAFGATPLLVTADGSKSTDPDATPIATYAFDFGDGTVVPAQPGA